MNVIVRKLHSKGRMLFKDEPERQAKFAGKLKVAENRLHKLGRVVITAQLIDTIDATATTVAELYDVVLLWADARQMRLRGFEEDTNGVQYAQTWEIEFT